MVEITNWILIKFYRILIYISIFFVTRSADHSAVNIDIAYIKVIKKQIYRYYNKIYPFNKNKNEY